MRVSGFMKGALAGGVGATAVLAATAAFAGTGIGGVFNLGQSNSVNNTTTLTGATPNAAQLKVNNTSSTGPATGLSVIAASTKPPITVSNTVQNPKLNAQYVGGYLANSLARVGIGSNAGLLGVSSTNTQTTVSITAPRKGFVRLDGSITAFDGFSTPYCGDCAVFARIHDDASGADSQLFYAEGGAGTHATSMVIPVNWVFPVSVGDHTYSLRTAQTIVSGGGFVMFNPVLTAQFVPFGSTGSPTTLSASAKTAKASARARRVPLRR